MTSIHRSRLPGQRILERPEQKCWLTVSTSIAVYLETAVWLYKVTVH